MSKAVEEAGDGKEAADGDVEGRKEGEVVGLDVPGQAEEEEEEEEELDPLERMAAKRRKQRAARRAREASGKVEEKEHDTAIVYAHATAADGGDGSGGDLVSRVKAFFYDDLLFTDEFNAWASERASSVDPASDEMKLEYTALHEEFVAFFEERVEKVIASAGGTPKQFYRQLKARVQQDGSGADATFTQVMLAAVEFQSFITLMKQVAREQRR